MGKISINLRAKLDKMVDTTMNTFEITNQIVKPAVDKYGLTADKISVNISNDEILGSQIEIVIGATGTDDQIIKVTNDLAEFAVAELKDEQ
jgi:hypothetical protein